MNKKLRLVVTDRCNRKCPLCCNNRFDLKSIPVFKRLDYEEISITGGEPMLFPGQTITLCYGIKHMQREMGIDSKIWLYTGLLSYHSWESLAQNPSCIDGICFTPHDNQAVIEFLKVDEYIRKYNPFPSDFSLRLNLFTPEFERLKDYDLGMWKVKRIKWIKDCPIPEGEDFYRINELFK